MTAQSLRVLLNLELATLEGCEGVEVREIMVRPFVDQEGCNWHVVAYSGLAAGGPERSLVEAMIAAQRYRYNIGRSG